MIKDSWNPQLYDNNHAFVSNYGNALIDILAPQKEENILDLGCGTGDLALQITNTGANVLGVDQSANMIEQAQLKYPHIPFQIADATALSFDHEFDAVFSNATLHWIKQPKAALHSIYNSLKPGGRFVAEFGGEGNVKLITDELIAQFHEAGIAYTPKDFPWYFPSIGAYTTLMEEAGFRVIFAQHFDRPTVLQDEDGLKIGVEMFGSAFFEQINSAQKSAIIENVEHNLKDKLYEENVWYADYKRIRVIGVK